MKTFRVVFEGREVGAIGILYTIEEEVTAAKIEDVKMALYNRFEHIRVTHIEEIY